VKNKTLPILLKNPKILLIGGGKVALQKAQVLHENNIDFKVIAHMCMEEIFILCSNIEVKKFEISDIEHFSIVIDATGNKEVTDALLLYKMEHSLLLNVVDVPSLCDFYFMALTKNRPLQIAVSSNGSSPTAAKYFRDECEMLIPDDIHEYLKRKQQERDNGSIDVKETRKELNQLNNGRNL
jgi:uroporphyrin-III C-methyltransferase/precorrin-2 dehydrogenase/sirohydrochlorin ferrochelatase